MTKAMRVFYCTDHATHWPVGGASVIVAADENEAQALLDQQLLNERMMTSHDSPYRLVELAIDKPIAVILDNGDY